MMTSKGSFKYDSLFNQTSAQVSAIELSLKQANKETANAK
jgi:hypothetical protein